MKRKNDFIKQVFVASRELMILADRGTQKADDNGCVVLSGIIRDCAYHMQAQARLEQDRHQQQEDFKERKRK